MKRLPLALIFALLLLPFLAPITAVHAQEPVTISGLQPDAGLPGSEMELRLFGSGFTLPEEMGLSIDDVEILDFRVESDEDLFAVIHIPPDAPPGRKTVTLSYVLDEIPFQAVLRGGFRVLPPEERPAARLELHRVEPAEGAPDTEMEIRLTGAGFTSVGEVAVHIEDIEIINQWTESDELIGLNIHIPADAWPGWRWVEVVGEASPAATLEEGFFVLETDRSPPPVSGPRDPDGRGDPIPPINWTWPLVTILLMGASYALGRGLAFRSQLSWTDKAKLQWRAEAKKELPEAQRACQWACKATAGANVMNRWQVKRIELTPLDVKGKTPPRKVVDNKSGALDPLNDLTNIADALRSQQAVRQQIAGVVEAILAQILAWEQEGQSPASVRLDAQLAGAIDATFGLYHCHQVGGVLSWGKDPLLKWKGKLNQPAGEFLGVLRGPMAGEADFAARARREIEECLLALIDGVRLWL